MTVWLYDRPKMLSEFAHEIHRRCRQPLRVGRFLRTLCPSRLALLPQVTDYWRSGLCKDLCKNDGFSSRFNPVVRLAERTDSIDSLLFGAWPRLVLTAHALNESLLARNI
jgi:hypothetical protein